MDQIRGAYETRDQELRQKFNRSLSFQDAMDDRWERAKRLGFGDGTSIYNSATIFGDVHVGRKTWIGPYVILEGVGGGITIGDTCSISSGVHIYTHNTIAWALSGGEIETQQAPVSIGDRNYIGSQSVIAAGVRIGDGCVIAANSFVNADVASGTVVGGTPARVLGRVEFRDKIPVIVYDNGKVTSLTNE
ncbi:MAG: acyltransferase [Alphaproteobacteria bacterium]|nr:acyltransferase [Alphaproteobacteria bacterium]